MNNIGKLEWFGGNQDALNMYRMFVDLAHTWDDLVDKDKAVSEDAINNAFLVCLAYLPANPFYQTIQQQVLPMWLTVISAYQVANHFEREKDPHGIEIAHSLRYAVGNIVAYAVHVCVGAEQAKQILPEVWKAIFFERFDEYRKEHLNG
jgi:purine-cytosine permease-like protein